MPNNSSPATKGKLPRNSTCWVYAPGPLVANAFETKCSIRNSPIGTIPVSECSLRQKKECPWPARNGETPFLILTGVALGADATKFPCEFKDDRRTFYYVGAGEGKSNRSTPLQKVTKRHAAMAVTG